MPDLKLPLIPRTINAHRYEICDADGWLVAVAFDVMGQDTQHRAELIVAALTKDQEEN